MPSARCSSCAISNAACAARSRTNAAARSASCRSRRSRWRKRSSGCRRNRAACSSRDRPHPAMRCAAWRPSRTSSPSASALCAAVCRSFRPARAGQAGQSGRPGRGRMRSLNAAQDEIARQKLDDRMRQGASALRDAGNKGGASGSQINQLANQQDGLAKAMAQVAQKMGSSVSGNNAEARKLSDQLAQVRDQKTKLDEIASRLEELAKQAGKQGANGASGKGQLGQQQGSRARDRSRESGRPERPERAGPERRESGRTERRSAGPERSEWPGPGPGPGPGSERIAAGQQLAGLAGFVRRPGQRPGRRSGSGRRREWRDGPAAG